MFAHFKGQIVWISPTQVVIDCGGVGYEMQISLNTYARLKDMKEALVYAHLSVKEDAHTLYGFADDQERQMFRLLLSVQGIGAATARMMLSSVQVTELQSAILSGNVALLKSVKGVGPKSAQRIVLELQDKMQRLGTDGESQIGGMAARGGIRDEAIAALLMLGFGKPSVEKAVSAVLDSTPSSLSVEEIIKNSLKRL